MHRYDYTMVPFTQKRELHPYEKILAPGNATGFSSEETGALRFPAPVR